MSTAKGKPTIDADLVRELASLLAETGLTEIEYGTDSWRVRVARNPAPAAALLGLGEEAGARAPLGPAPAPPDEAEALLQHPGLLTSPMVGVVYTAPEPGAPPFVKVGDRVEAGATLLLIEAMKVFNPIRAPRAGVIVRMLVSNGVPVEYGEPLVVIE
jgi:acetyl-CoA carboxylase biotin carboxyl carrier protein